MARRVEPELGLQHIQEVFWWPLPDAHGAVALDVGMSPYRKKPRSWFAKVALSERDLTDLLDCGDRVKAESQSIGS